MLLYAMLFSWVNNKKKTMYSRTEKIDQDF